MEQKPPSKPLPEKPKVSPRRGENAPDLDVDKERHAEEQVLRDEWPDRKEIRSA